MLTAARFFVLKSIVTLVVFFMNKAPDTILAHHKDITSAAIVYAAVQ